MKISLYVIGKTNQSYLQKGIDDYVKRIKRYVNFTIELIPEPKNASKLKPDILKEAEADLVLKKIDSSKCKLVLLDENGLESNSVNFAKKIEHGMVYESQDIAFLIGGPYGFSRRIYDVAKEKISLSKMTYSHQLIRLVFVEQLYRAFTIIKGEPYHHG